MFDLRSWLTGFVAALTGGKPPLPNVACMTGWLAGLRVRMQWTTAEVPEPEEPEVAAALYLYGHPDEGGNVAYRSGDTVTVYNGGLAPALPEWDKEAYPYVSLSYASLNVLRALRFSASPSYREDGKVKWFIPAPYMSCGLNSATDYTEWKEPTLSEETEDYQLVLGVWANHDIYNVDGTLFQAASEPIPIYKDAETYLYNGVELPPLPEWDKEAYPYAYIPQVTTSADWVYLCVCTSPIFEHNDQGNWGPKGLKIAKCMYKEKWEALEEQSESIPAIENVLWANFDLLNEDGSVLRAASSPIPVYE